MTGSIRNFEKLNFTPKSSVFCSSQGQTSKYDRLAHTPRTRDRCPHRALSSASESQKNRALLKIQCQWSFTEVCSRFKLIYTPKFTAIQIFHTIAKQQSESAYTCTLEFSLFKPIILKSLLSYSIRKLSCSISIYIINIVY